MEADRRGHLLEIVERGSAAVMTRLTRGLFVWWKEERTLRCVARNACGWVHGDARVTLVLVLRRLRGVSRREDRSIRSESVRPLSPQLAVELQLGVDLLSFLLPFHHVPLLGVLGLLDKLFLRGTPAGCELGHEVQRAERRRHLSAELEDAA